MSKQIVEQWEIAWTAGLLEGEGSFYWRDSKTLKVSCGSTDLDILEQLRDIWGGSIYETAKQKSHHKQAWVWIVHGIQAKSLMVAVLPYMMSRRGQKIKECLDLDLAHQQSKQDWVDKCMVAAVEYKTTGQSLRTVASKHGVSYVTVKKFADKL